MSEINEANAEETTILFGALDEKQVKGNHAYAFIKDIPQNVREAGAKLLGDIKEAYPHMKEGFMNCMNSVGTALDPRTAPDRIKAALTSVGKYFSELRETIKNDKRPIGDKIRGAWDSFTKMVSGACAKIAEKSKPTLDAAGEKFVQAWNAVQESRLGKGAAAAYEKAKEVGSNMAGKIHEAGKKAYNSIPSRKRSDSNEMKL